jgi:hypothetical protein
VGLVLWVVYQRRAERAHRPAEGWRVVSLAVGAPLGLAAGVVAGLQVAVVVAVAVVVVVVVVVVVAVVHLRPCLDK